MQTTNAAFLYFFFVDCILLCFTITNNTINQLYNLNIDWLYYFILYCCIDGNFVIISGCTPLPDKSSAGYRCVTSAVDTVYLETNMRHGQWPSIISKYKTQIIVYSHSRRDRDPNPWFQLPGGLREQHYRYQCVGVYLYAMRYAGDVTVGLELQCLQTILKGHTLAYATSRKVASSIPY
jgi:hypothetical protein